MSDKFSVWTTPVVGLHVTPVHEHGDVVSEEELAASGAQLVRRPDGSEEMESCLNESKVVASSSVAKRDGTEEEKSVSMKRKKERYFMILAVGRR
jgi:hypothetical protein